MRTIAHLYDNYDAAENVVRELESSGFSHERISLIANQGSTSSAARVGEPSSESPGASGTGAGTGASIGTIVGGSAGLLAGIGALAIPGVGPVVAAGWLMATLAGAGAGAAAGGLLGALAGAGIPEEHAHVYAEGVRRGGSLVSVQAEDTQASEAEAIMQRYHPADLAEREAGYRDADDWSGFDPNRADLTPEELAIERQRLGSTTSAL